MRSTYQKSRTKGDQISPSDGRDTLTFSKYTKKEDQSSKYIHPTPFQSIVKRAQYHDGPVVIIIHRYLPSIVHISIMLFSTVYGLF